MVGVGVGWGEVGGEGGVGGGGRVGGRGLEGGDGEGGGHVGGGLGEGGEQGLVEEAAGVSGVPGGAGGGELGGVGVGEEGVEVMDGLGRADAAKGGEDDGEEGAALSDAASEMCVVLLCFMRPSIKTPDTAPRLTGLPPQGRTYNTSASRQCFLVKPAAKQSSRRSAPLLPLFGG